MLDELINTRPLFVHRDTTIDAAVHVMIDAGVSSILIHDDRRLVVGILTERDIVRKFTLLDLDLKWGKTVGTIMTRPVAFVRLAHIEEDVVRLHFDLGLRHFPVLLNGPATTDNVIGIVTVTDVCRGYLEALNLRRTGRRGSAAS